MTAEAREVLAVHSKSFALAGRLLPAQSRDDAAVLYAWCRRADDAVDLNRGIDAARRLSELRVELASIYSGQPQAVPLLAAFQNVVVRRGIPVAHPRALLDGFETDLGVVRIASMSELLLYAHRVAGVVGLMMCHVLGARGPSALRHAAHLGIAMQLTNICRDVVEDWERGRMYLPDDILSESGAPKLAAHLGGPLERSHGPALAGALRKLLALADQYYCSGDAGLPALPSRAAFAVRAARLVYADIGRNLARRDFDVFAGRAVVSQTRKLTLVARAAVEELGARCWAFLRRAKPRGLADVRPLPRPADPEGSFLLDD